MNPKAFNYTTALDTLVHKHSKMGNLKCLFTHSNFALIWHIIGLHRMKPNRNVSNWKASHIFTAFTTSSFKARMTEAGEPLWVYSYLFPCCISVWDASLSSLRCRSSVQRQLSEMITKTASKPPSLLSAGGRLCPAHRRACPVHHTDPHGLA